MGEVGGGPADHTDTHVAQAILPELLRPEHVLRRTAGRVRPAVLDAAVELAREVPPGPPEVDPAHEAVLVVQRLLPLRLRDPEGVHDDGGPRLARALRERGREPEGPACAGHARPAAPRRAHLIQFRHTDKATPEAGVRRSDGGLDGQQPRCVDDRVRRPGHEHPADDDHPVRRHLADSAHEAVRLVPAGLGRRDVYDGRRAAEERQPVHDQGRGACQDRARRGVPEERDGADGPQVRGLGRRLHEGPSVDSADHTLQVARRHERGQFPVRDAESGQLVPGHGVVGTAHQGADGGRARGTHQSTVPPTRPRPRLCAASPVDATAL